MIQVRDLPWPEVAARLDEIAALRITVFRDWPYLYDGDMAYERAYLRPLLDSPLAVVVGAFQGARLVGAATGAPLVDHAGDLAQALDGAGLNLSDIYYCAESVLLSDFRGQGVGHRFFDSRERFARRSGFPKIAFCSVQRPGNHPARPPAYRPLDPFWRGRGYAPVPGALARLAWRDLGQTTETDKPMQLWLKDLT